MGSRFARTLRKRAPKNPRADGLAPARGQHSIVELFAISIFCCAFLAVRRGGFNIRPRYTRTCRGVSAWRRITSAAIQQSWHARAVQCPTGALIAARPRNAAPYVQPCKWCRGEHCSPAKISRGRKTPRADIESAPTAKRFWPRRGQTEKGSKALRKMQHSCIF